jgi:hypothetical protein
MRYLEALECYEFECTGRKWKEWRVRVTGGTLDAGISVAPPGELTGAESLELISFLVASMHARVPLGEEKAPSGIVTPQTIVRPGVM